jgi:hypothetical protein
MMKDNQGLLTRIKSSLPFPEPFPNITLALDWVVTHEISCSLQTFPHPPLLQHVKGQQDSHTAYMALPLEAQLNVDANAEAHYILKTISGHCK